MIRYLAFWLGSKLAPLMPLTWGYRLCSVAGWLAYRLAPGARRAVEANLSQILGEGVSSAEMEPKVKAVFVNGARAYFELLRMSRFDPDELDRRLIFHDLEYLHRAVAEGRGVIIATAHMGNSDLVAQCLRRLFPSHEVIIPVEPIRPEPLLRLVTGLRASQGLSYVPLSVNILKQALGLLRKGGLVALAIDRDIQGRGVRVPFFGQETSMPVGALELARRTGAAIVPSFCIQRNDGRFDVYVEPPITLDWTGSAEADLRSNLLKQVAVLEGYLRRFPEQWVVFQPVWSKEGVRLGVRGSSHIIASAS